MVEAAPPDDAQATDLLGKRGGQGFEPPLEGAPGREASLLTKELAHHPHLGVGASRTAKSSPTLCSLLRIMITSAFIKSFWE
jgi:hypothetical protein